VTAELTYSHNSKSTWPTPQPLFDVLDREFHFTIDLAAEPPTAKCHRFYTKEQDALRQDWSGEGGFLNPPYTRGVIDRFAQRAWSYAQFRDAATTVVLVPASVDTQWWWNWARHAEVRFIALGRLQFGEYLDKKTGKMRSGGAPFRSAVLIFRPGLPQPDYSKLFWDWKAEGVVVDA